MKSNQYSNGGKRIAALEVDQDDDLKDLIDKKGSNRIVSNGSSSHASGHNSFSVVMGSLRYMIHNCCYFYPVTCGIISIFSIGCVMWLFLGYIINPTEIYGRIEHDHSDINSKFDLKMSEIKHWCLGQNDDSCTCDDPLIPLARTDHSSWIVAVKNNRLRVDSYTSMDKNPDVAFLGESIIEEMDGRWLGKDRRSIGLTRLHNMFEANFKQKKTSPNDHEHKDGVALGIAGDTCANVLWRLLHGEMPDNFNPKVWWLSLGMNDLARTKCSEEVVLIGILRIVEEIISTKPDAHVVINSLLPITMLRGGAYPIISDVEDSFTSKADNEKDPAAGRLLQKKNATTKLEVEAEEEEIQRDNKVKKQNMGVKKIWTKKTPKNVEVLKEKTKMKKFKPGHIRENSLPLWTSVKVINAALKKFAEKHSNRVSYFDATPLFAQPKSKGKYEIRTDRLSPRGHPTLEGFRVLETEMIKFLDPILINLYADIVNKNDDELIQKPDSFANYKDKDYMDDDKIGGGWDDTMGGNGRYVDDDDIFSNLDSLQQDDEFLFWGDPSEITDDFGFQMEDDFAV